MGDDVLNGWVSVLNLISGSRRPPPREAFIKGTSGFYVLYGGLRDNAISLKLEALGIPKGISRFFGGGERLSGTVKKGWRIIGVLPVLHGAINNMKPL